MMKQDVALIMAQIDMLLSAIEDVTACIEQQQDRVPGFEALRLLQENLKDNVGELFCEIQEPLRYSNGSLVPSTGDFRRKPPLLIAR